MIKRIDDLLIAWGRWVVRSDSRGLGYASVCPMFRDTPPSVGFDSSPPPGVFTGAENANAINAVVSGLAKDQRALCYEVYVVTGRTRLQVAQAMGISRDTLYQWIARLHRRVESDLCYESIGEK